MLPARFLLCELLLAVCCPTVVLRAEDWPQGRGPMRTGQAAAGARVPESLSAEPKILWRLKVGEGFASPVVADGKVFHFDNQDGKETLHALKAQDAQEF